jgi:hypothetical protein
MKKMQQKSKRIQIYKIGHKLPLEASHKDGKHQSPPRPQSSKARSIKGFDENINQLSLCMNVSHLNISLLYMVSQEVVSHVKVSHSFVENWILGYRDGTGIVAYGGTCRRSLQSLSSCAQSIGFGSSN